MAAPVSVGELQRAWWALQRGDYRHAASGHRVVRGAAERQVLVVGAAGQAGASTLALALAEASAASRLVDCAPTAASGLVGVCDRELGRLPSGWWRGLRGDLLVERSPLHNAASADACPSAELLPEGTSVIDAGFDVSSVAAGEGWLGDMLRDQSVPVVVVARCTVPGLRRLAGALDVALLPGRDVRVAVVGPPPRRWPRSMAAPPSVAALADQGRLVYVPLLDALAMNGLGVDPLPAPLLGAAKALIEEGTTP